MTAKNRERVSNAVRSVVVLAIVVVCAIPLYYVVVNSFKTSVDMIKRPLALPSSWTLSNYAEAFADGTIVRSFINTLVITVVGVAVQVLIGSLAAYGMIVKRSRFTAAVGAILMVAFTIPGQAVMIPQYKMEASLKLTDTLTGLIILYSGGAIFCYFLIVGYMSKLPAELFEAAKIDGAGPWRIYWSIVLPLIRPILITVIVFQTMGTWNDFVTPRIYISSAEKQTVVLQVYNAVQQFSTNWPLFMAITVLALLPVFVFFVLCQKYIVSGLVAGSVKG